MDNGQSEFQQYQKAMSQSMHYLSFRPRTHYEIAVYLKKKGHDDQIVERALLRLNELKLINDQQFAWDYKEQKMDLSSNPIGPMKLVKELQKKGISEHVIDQIRQAISTEDEYRLMKKIIKKKFARLSLSTWENKQKVALHLEGKGFSREGIRTLLDMFD